MNNMNNVKHLVAEALAEVKAAQAAHERAVTRLELALQHAVQQGIEHLPASEALPSAHRRAHRPGVQRRIDADPELRVFICARIDSHTFEAISADVAAHFPPKRRVSRSAIHDWWKRERKG